MRVKRNELPGAGEVKRGGNGKGGVIEWRVERA